MKTFDKVKFEFLLKRKGIKEIEVAEFLGIGKSAFSQLKSKGEPKEETILKIAEFLKVDVSDLEPDSFDLKTKWEELMQYMKAKDEVIKQQSSTITVLSNMLANFGNMGKFDRLDKIPVSKNRRKIVIFRPVYPTIQTAI